MLHVRWVVVVVVVVWLVVDGRCCLLLFAMVLCRRVPEMNCGVRLVSVVVFVLVVSILVVLWLVMEDSWVVVIMLGSIRDGGLNGCVP